MKLSYLVICMAIMAGMTYLIRVLPMAIFRKRIKSVFVQSFLYYVPYAVLAAMTFPAIFYSTGASTGEGNVLGAAVGTAVAVLLAFLRKGLLTVAVGASAAVFLAQLLW